MHIAPFYHRSIFDDLDDFDNLLWGGWPNWGWNPKQQQQQRRRAATPKKWSTTVALPGFRSNEVQIERSADNSSVKVLARRDEEGDFNEVRRTIQVPDNVDRSQLQVEFTREGALVAYAPLKQSENCNGQSADRRQGLDMGSGTLMRQQNPAMQQLANDMWMLASESFPGCMQSHVERGEDGSSCKLNLDFHLAGYKPEEIAVSHEGDHVTVEARHESRSEHGSSYKHFKRVFSLPKTVDAEKLTSRLLSDGRLRLEAPCSVDYAQQPALNDQEIKVKRATDK